MNPSAEWLVLTASACLIAGLVLAWCLSGIRYFSLGFLKALFPSFAYLLRSHIDFLMMATLLMVVFLGFAHFAINPPGLIIVALCLGSLINPSGFLALAIKPDLPQTPTSLFGIYGAFGFVATTLGYAGAAWLLAQAALTA